MASVHGRECDSVNFPARVNCIKSEIVRQTGQIFTLGFCHRGVFGTINDARR